ncbi:hypothetical protein PsorP6_005095 [Peronosclerospora sorghi]|uniref:Uncharacterized protein n=1 Tax=Peronosclerospora sorghi TaxID=230839 RepID=A0ACC0W4I1_9STRA|nr:hypothetical protein PsorP6_005095 [Peronosclerospora sorghi]
MQSPTKLRTPTKLVRPRQTHWAARAKDVQKRLLEAESNQFKDAVLAPKRVKLTQSTAESKTETSTGEGFEVHAAFQHLNEEGEPSYTEKLHRRVKVAQCLKQDLVRENARLKLQVLGLKDDVDFYCDILAKIELVVAQQQRETREKNSEEQKQIAELAERLRHVLSASKATSI